MRRLSVLSMILLLVSSLFPSNVFAESDTRVYVGIDGGTSDQDFINEDGYARSEVNVTSWQAGIEGSAYAELSSSGIGMGINTQNYINPSSIIHNRSQIWDVFSLEGPGDSVDALLNLRLSGDMFMAAPPTWVGDYQNNIIVDTTVRQGPTVLNSNTSWFGIDWFAGAGAPSPGFNANITGSDYSITTSPWSAGTSFPFDGYLTTFTNYPIAVNMDDLPLDAELQYIITLRSYTDGIARNNFSDTLTFDPDAALLFGEFNGQGGFTPFSDQTLYMVQTGSGFGTEPGDQSEPGGGSGSDGEPVVPEPATMLLFASGLMGGAFVRRRRRS